MVAKLAKWRLKVKFPVPSPGSAEFGVLRLPYKPGNVSNLEMPRLKRRL
jgi:hypothetical protein